MLNLIKPIGKELLLLLVVIISAALANLVGVPEISIGLLLLFAFIGAYAGRKLARAKSTAKSHSS